MLIIEYGAKVAIIFLTTILLYHFFFFLIDSATVVAESQLCCFAKLIVRDEIECFCIKKSIQTNEV